jgi:hypothetical protein
MIPARAGPTTRAVCTSTLVEADRVDQPLGADQLDHEALPGRVVDGEHGAAGEGGDVDHRRRHHPGGGDREQPDRRQRHQHLGGDQQPPLRDAVGEQPAPGAEEQHRQELQRGDEADSDARAGQAEDQPDSGDHLHPVARERDQLADEVAAIVGNRE